MRENEREIKRERKIEKERERVSFVILYTGYLLSIVKIKRKIDRERETKTARKKWDKKASAKASVSFISVSHLR